MGVPAFFRWLSVRYPKIVLNALTEDELEYLYDEFEQGDNGGDANEIDLNADDIDAAEKKSLVSRDIQKKIKDNNPEFDNLYLDMNGIIHPCTHPPGKEQPKNEIEMFNNVFEYVDKIMNIVRPQKLIYMAIDGVAPRAKMNQQRSRRFRGALEVEEQQIREQEIWNQWHEQIKFTDATLGKDEAKFDKNVITPGTEFMWKLTKALQFFITERLNSHPLWNGVKVVFSDASIPGEGEHKMLDFIRSQRCQPGYDPNTRHCIYGADADLIMLGLSTHEPHFCVLREAFITDNEKQCLRCSQMGHLVGDCPQNKENQGKSTIAKSVQFQFIKLNVVREYLYLEFSDAQLPFPFDFERIIDDFVFFCFFVGNDFLPHSPSLHIREGAIDAIMAIYKQQLPALGDYLTFNGKIDFNRVDLILNDIAKIEEELIKSKKAYEDRMKQQRSQGGQRPQHQRLDQQPTTPKREEETKVPDDVVTSPPNNHESKSFKALAELQDQQASMTEEELNKLAAKKLKEIVKNMLAERSEKRAEKYVDKVQLGEEGWKLRYYQNKFHVSQEDLPEFLRNIRQAYLEGLQWVYSYYYNGCVSWTWFYPYHYAPFAGDLINAGSIDIKFDMGEPASPFEQLLGVFPKQSAHAIPVCYRYLLSDPKSEIIDFYPTNFHIDVNGARYEWMGVALLPFIDRERLVQAMKSADRNGEALNQHEKELNGRGHVLVFMKYDPKSQSGLMQVLNQLSQKPGKEGAQIELMASFERKDPLSGSVKIKKGEIGLGKREKKPFQQLSLDDVEDNQVFKIQFEQASYNQHITKLLKNISEPDRQVEDFEIFHINRRFFGGERAIKMLEGVLGFESTISAIQRGGYQNNRATYYDGVQQQRTYGRQGGGSSYQRQQVSQGSGQQESQLGKRHSRDFNDSEEQKYSQQSHHRPRQDGNGQRRDNRSTNYPYQGRTYGSYNNSYYQQNQNYYNSYQQGPPLQQQYNQGYAPPQYNLHQYQQNQGANQYQQQHQQYPYQQQTQGSGQQEQQPPAENTVLIAPQPSATLMGLLSQLNQVVGTQPSQGQQSQQQQQQRNQNRFQGFMGQ